MNTVFTVTRTKGFGLQLKAFVYFLIIEFLKILIQKSFFVLDPASEYTGVFNNPFS